MRARIGPSTILSKPDIWTNEAMAAEIDEKQEESQTRHLHSPLGRCFILEESKRGSIHIKKAPCTEQSPIIFRWHFSTHFIFWKSEEATL